MSKLQNPYLLLAITLLAVIAVLIIKPVGASVEPEKPRLTVSVQTVKKQDEYTILRYFPALAEAQQTVSMGSEIPGKITRVYVDDGDLVAEGQALFELDTQLLETQKQSLTARLESIKPELELINKRLLRQQNLKQQSFSSEDNIDALEASRQTLVANIKSLEAQIADIDIRLNKSTIYAPFNASIQRRLLDEGAVISAGTPVLHLVGSQVTELITGLPADIVAGLDEKSYYTALSGNKSIPVVLQRILPGINPITQTQGVKFAVAPDVKLTASGYLKLGLEAKYPVQGFWLPNTALVEGPRGLWEIFVVTPESRVKKYSVSVVYPSNPESYVTSAIPDGSKVVIEGVHRLAQNIAVNIVQQVAEAR
jgi:RND family efflux transporter MFP subunit